MRFVRVAFLLFLCLLLLYLFAPEQQARENGGFLPLSRRVTARLLESEEARAVFGIENGEEWFV